MTIQTPGRIDEDTLPPRTSILRRPVLLLSVAFLSLLGLLALFGSWVAFYDIDEGNVRETFAGPSAEHWLGTDKFGRDILSRLIFSTRVSVMALIVALGITAVLGGLGGLIAGYFGGWTDRILTRLSDAAMSLPGLMLAIGVVAVLGPDLLTVMIALGLMMAPRLLRVVRSVVLGIRAETYVMNAETLALRRLRIIFRHIAPNALPAAVSQLTVMATIVLVAEASLSYLGLGAQPPSTSWGLMISDAAATMRMSVWPIIPPGLAIIGTALALHFAGEALSDRLIFQSPPAARRSTRSAPGGSEVVPDEVSGASSGDSLVVVRNLVVEAPYPDGTSGAVVSGVSFEVARGEVLAIIGESGCGKTVTGLSMLGLLPKPLKAHGSIMVDGGNLLDLKAKDWPAVRGSTVGMIFQEPSSALTPTMTIGRQLKEVLVIKRGLTAAVAAAESAELLRRVGILDPVRRLKQHPHELSGGMAQRVMLALALAGKPKLLIADEPTTALDVTVQAKVLDLLRDIVVQEDMAAVLITHDVGVVSDLADRVAVMYAGRIVETGTAADVLLHPQHFYTRALIEATPRGTPKGGRLTTIRGSVPPPWEWASGCRFRDRCDHARTACQSDVPVVAAWQGTRESACVVTRAAARDPERTSTT